jgi:hypothetical protein
VDESHGIRLVELAHQMTAEVEGLPVDFQVIDLQLEPVDEEHRRNWHRPGAREEKPLRSSPGKCHNGMYFHGTKLHIVAVVRTMKQLSPRVWGCTDTSRPCAFFPEYVIGAQTTEMRSQFDHARISKGPRDDYFRLSADAQLDHLGE